MRAARKKLKSRWRIEGIAIAVYEKLYLEAGGHDQYLLILEVYSAGFMGAQW